MLGKLLKYDTKSLSKLIFPISLIALLATGIGCGLIAFDNTYLANTQDTTVIDSVLCAGANRIRHCRSDYSH